MHIDESKKFDRRTIKRNLREGIISPEELKKFLRALPDVSDKADFSMSEEGQTEETTKEEVRNSKESVEKETTPEKEQ